MMWVAGRAALDLRGGLHAVEVGHHQVHEHDVRRQLHGPLHGLVAVARVADDLDVGLELEVSAQSLAHDAVVVDDAAPESGRCHAGARWVMSWRVLARAAPAQTRVPWPGALVTFRQPPTAWARSRMLAIPSERERARRLVSKPSPSSIVHTSTTSVSKRTSTRVSVAWACLTTLFRLSWTIRKAASSMRPGSRRSTPSTCRLTRSPSRLWSAARCFLSADTSPSSWSAIGRSWKISARISASAPWATSWARSSRSRALPASRSHSVSAAFESSVTLNRLCVTESWSSRASRLRSSTTAYSRVSSYSRAFSIATAAWLAKKVASSASRSVKPSSPCLL